MPLDTTPLPFPKPAVPQIAPADLTLTLVNRTQETADIVSFTFDVADGGVQHLPGQAVMLELPLPDGVQSRVFTICSSGLNRHQITTTVKAGPEALATRWMQDHLTIGTRLKARGPLGRFSLAYHPGRPLVLIGGGSGFTPAMSMLRWLHGRRETTPVTVIQTARSVDDLLFRDELARIASEMPSLRLFLVPSEVLAGESWSGYRGLIDRPMMRAMVGSPHGKVAFCCGPQGFMDHVERVLCAEGLPRTDFHTESFGAPKRAAPAPTATPDTEIGQSAMVTFRGRQVEIAQGQTLAKGLAAQHLRIPTACGIGMCGTCKVKLVAGTVDMNDAGGLSTREKDQGYILTCCSTAKGSVTLVDPDL